MQLDRIDGKPDDNVAWGSDVAAQMLRRLGVRYVSLNPGASYRGLHDSIVNHLGNERPGILLCLHEDHSVAIAHGYAKAAGEPMACVLHSNVGLLHGMMSLFNAWCDRAPMIVLGATGPLDAEKRRPWIDWIHTSRDQGAYIRSIIKWDDQPSSPQALVESMCRAHIATRTAPTAPVYICLDAGLQESRLEKPPEWPDVSRFVPAEPPRPAKSALDRAAALLARAERPVIMFGRGSRKEEFWQPRIRLAERLGACVVTDLKQGAMFPTDHPAHHLPPFNVLPKPARELLREADVILALDWVDLGGALRQAKAGGPVAAEVIAATLDQNLHTGANMEYQALPAVDVAMAATGDAVVEELVAALGPDRREPWKARPPAKAAGGPGITMEHIASTLRAEFNDPENVSFCTLGRGWPIDIWPFQDGLAYLGKDGGGGLGPDPGFRSGRRWRCKASDAMRSRCSATAISAWVRRRSGRRCVIASRCSCWSTTTGPISTTNCTRRRLRARAAETSPTAGSGCACRTPRRTSPSLPRRRAPSEWGRSRRRPRSGRRSPRGYRCSNRAASA